MAVETRFSPLWNDSFCGWLFLWDFYGKSLDQWFPPYLPSLWVACVMCLWILVWRLLCSSSEVVMKDDGDCSWHRAHCSCHRTQHSTIQLGNSFLGPSFSLSWQCLTVFNISPDYLEWMTAIRSCLHSLLSWAVNTEDVAVERPWICIAPSFPLRFRLLLKLCFVVWFSVL